MTVLIASLRVLAMLLGFSAGLYSAVGSGQSPPTAEKIDFNAQIRPILSDRCFACHGPDAAERQADLRLDEAAAATEFAIVPGDSGASPLVERITSADPNLVMPPPEHGSPLSPEETALISEWIDQGGGYAEHWAYVQPVAVQTPMLHDDGWSRHWIDRFVLDKLQQHRLRPNHDAEPVSLIRRLAFDLTGLPPSQAQVRSFLADPSEERYLAMVDQYLASPAFGERLATMWLDLVRYADTVGYHGDQDHNISPYRDWVIQSLNANMPFDQFTREQLAGDLLPNPTLEQQIATGYNRLLQTSHEGGVQPKEYLAIYQADRVRNLSAVWMGATVGCAQCHDHKYDPYSAHDFYALAAFFADLDEAQHFAVGTNSLPTKRPPEIAILPTELQSERDQLSSQVRTLQTEQGNNAEVKEQIAALEKRIAEIDQQARWTMVSKSIEPRAVRLLPRGNWLDDSGPIVQPDVPHFLQRPLAGGGRPNRLDLANWLVDVDRGVGGLTARVMANRFWYALFGRGLSTSLEDFGGQGVPPTHPELLDRLAIEFYQSGWDVKHLLREIVASRTYRLSSRLGHGALQSLRSRELFAVQGRYRLPAEMIRDTALALSELLVYDSSHPTSRPYQPAGYYRHLNFPEREYQADRDAAQYRRGVYVHWQRQFLHPMYRAFDAPTREECTAQRPRSNTPLSALVLLNDPSFVEAARGLASRALACEATDETSRLENLFECAVGRVPDEAELALLRLTLHEARDSFLQGSLDAEALLEVGIGNSLERLDGTYALHEIAAWCEVSRLVLNLNETMVRP